MLMNSGNLTGPTRTIDERIRLRSFQPSFLAILTGMVAGLLIQKLHPDFTRLNSVATVASALVILGVLALVVVFRKELYQVLSSYQFAIAIVTVTTLATILGTVILQNGTVGDYTSYYGVSLTSVFFVFFLNDIFHSLWYCTLLLLISVSLLLVLIKRRFFRLTQLGFLFSHMGIIIILLGGLVGLMAGQKGFIDLVKGQSAHSMGITKGGKLTGAAGNLGFGLRLDDFQVDYYPSEYKIYAFRLNPDSKRFEVVGSYKLKRGKKYSIPGTDVDFVVRRTEQDSTPRADLVLGNSLETETLTYGTPLRLAGGRLVLAIDRRQDDVKEYRSLVSMWEGGRKVRSATIQVNHPLSYRGYAFYQANFDPKNPDYSGIEVVRDPGLPLVYVGFLMLSLGVIYIFYITPRIVDFRRRRAEKKAVRHVAD
jgi:hypothetical protein